MEKENTGINASNYAETAAQKGKSNRLGKIIVLALLAAAVVIYFAVPAVNDWVNAVVAMFKTGNFAAMRAFISQYGPWAMAISFLMMMFQSVAAPLPAFFITLTNANLFGWWQGAILSWSSAMAGAALCFWIARLLGRDVVEKICTKRALAQIDGFFDKYGKKSILVARLLPFISFDIVSYAAGLTSMDFWGFFVATGVGQLPATIVYSYVGGMLTGGAKMMFVGLLCLFSLALLVTIIRSVWTSKQKAKEAEALAAGLELPPAEKWSWMRFLRKFYNCALWGMTAALLASMSIFVSMRMNLGWIFFGVWILLLLVFGLLRRFETGRKFTGINLLACTLINLVLLGPDKLENLPAAVIREGLAQTRWSLDTINLVLLVFVVLGYAFVFVSDRRQSMQQSDVEAASA